MTLTLEHNDRTYKLTIEDAEPTLDNLQSACILIDQWIKDSHKANGSSQD